MPIKKPITQEDGYNLATGLAKTVKNFMTIMGPTLLAILASVPPKYAWIAGFLGYFIKNYLENK